MNVTVIPLLVFTYGVDTLVFSLPPLTLVF
jgi:hypothetical protein